ncbi:hypothetical protein AQI95_34390 [Streptomyces yokosukanensis]|uniref:Uncharacterized protein n=1 Tax=Streptomyces yokosukanensis TaxID=67386 RepID=A0A124HEG0_9ACTN|nr:hypothetical protein AQI95_34390 [Streptomyces yokosukanensis]
MIVYDNRRDMVARVTGMRAAMVVLVRPMGRPWCSRWASVRPATEREQRQLQALARLHIQRRKGLRIPT